MAKFLENQEDLKPLVESDGLVVVDFFATWCGPCKMLMPIFDDVSGKYENVKFVKVDIDKFPDLAEEKNVRGVPSVFFYKDGQLQEISKGFKPADQLSKIVEQYI